MKKGKGFNELSFGINHENPSSVGTVHAERAAINKLPYRPINKKPLKVSILVIRFTSSGKLGNSKCCHKCIFDMGTLPSLKGYKITKVYYSNRDGDIVKTNLKELNLDENNYLFHAGTEIKDNKIYAVGGRVLNFISLSNTYSEAKKNIHENLEKLNWEKGFFRRDIGYKVIDK